MFYWKTFYNKEIAEMVFEYLKWIFGYKVTLEHRWHYEIVISNPDLEHLTDVQKEMVKFFIPHMFNKNETI